MNKQLRSGEVIESFVLEASEMGAVAKALTLWWLTPKRCVLRRIELRAGNFELEMWNGTRYTFTLNSSKITWQKHQNGHRIIFFENQIDGSKFRIVEFAGMYPNGEADFTQLIRVMDASPAWWYRLAKHLVPAPLERVMDQLTDCTEEH